MWTLDRFVRELQQIRDALGLHEVHLLGHSWGTMLAAEYVLEQPPGVRSVVLSGPVLSARKYLDGLAVLRSRLPDDVRATLDRHERDGTTSDAEYQTAVEFFYARHMSLLPSRPPEVQAAWDQFGSACYEVMWGPSEFLMTGNLRDFDVTARLPGIHVPVLLTAGRADLTRPEEAEDYRRLIPGARLEVFEHSAHVPMLEEPEAFVAVVRRFLRHA